MDSATFRAKHEDAATFAAELKQSAMIADLIDGVTALCYMISKTHGGKPQKPKPYPRPWVDSGAKRIGSNPIPISQFNDWYYGGE